MLYQNVFCLLHVVQYTETEFVLKLIYCIQPQIAFSTGVTLKLPLHEASREGSQVG
jgi:hypothetical protein